VHLPVWYPPRGLGGCFITGIIPGGFHEAGYGRVFTGPDPGYLSKSQKEKAGLTGFPGFLFKKSPEIRAVLDILCRCI